MDKLWKNKRKNPQTEQTVNAYNTGPKIPLIGFVLNLSELQ